MHPNHPCWEKTPCIHIIRVLHYREEYWRVWEYAGKEYSLTEAKKTTGELCDIEMSLLNDMLIQRSIESDSSFIWRNASKGNMIWRNASKGNMIWRTASKGNMIWRNASKGNGQNKKRFKSRGEYNEPVKRTKKCHLLTTPRDMLSTIARYP